MTSQDTQRPSLRDFDATADRNGQDLGQDSPLDIGVPSRTQADLLSRPDGEAETARIASGKPGQDATDATEAETPPENLARLRGETGASEIGKDASGEAIERATAALGQDDGKR
ncbi:MULTISPECIES: hypothetical protein [Methylobacterium]|uniref:Uncharacterized protein n=1 Tax=Methylobacterium jeotgali TaxID=381630 RepID=A0ABQ4SS21_9HYPH|nr:MULTISPECIES: hypothetical protein [Methylobacterium]PIU04845.1 MAG: hypothetical protein COT56_18075 [Methylobacterium sp. CG09_land_8_20_14_0_10_71_15]PIU16057.1 MAG: hypothetical protein COT28_02010 [Methylobacterium sp. CG08_land_8_20_14_0_20_71_15]GBU18680.1 hypothetical protein AwMethylo_28950 [Methylobacterium sp.]GJE05987.1 hypothetical protein AOPFMNJM_1293 [Methylobacterium jeotgali]